MKTILIILLILCGCNQKEPDKVEQIIHSDFSKRIIKVPTIKHFDDKLGIYCQSSEKTNLNINPPKCIPYSGSIYYSDQNCQSPELATIIDRDNIVPEYVTGDGKFYKLGPKRIKSGTFYFLDEGVCREASALLDGYDVDCELKIQEFGDLL